MNVRIIVGAALVSLVTALGLSVVGTRPEPASAATYAAVDAAGQHTCALTPTFGVQCWGRNLEGQLGDGTTTSKTRPVAVSGLAGSIGSIGIGARHSCAVTVFGRVKCWGYNSHGQLGDGTTTGRTVPVLVCASGSGAGCPALTGVVAVAGGEYHTCALTSGGGVKCWGRNDEAQLGDGTKAHSPLPVDVSGLTSGVAALTVGGKHSCVTLTAGGAKCWGDNDYGQLGDGTSRNHRTSPVAVSGLTDFTSLSAGADHTCAVVGGNVKCWGSNFGYQLGDGTQTNRSTPVTVCASGSGSNCTALAGVSAVAAADAHTCAVMTTSALKCWGWDGFGQLGDGGVTSLVTFALNPVNVEGLTGASGEPAVSAATGGGGHTCALSTTGLVKCWGWNSAGQLGEGTITNTASATDFDLDGCATSRELGTNETTGGRRNPENFWDFFDTPDADNVRDRIVTSDDVGRVQARYFTDGDPSIDPLSPPPPTGYHTAFDRTDDPNSSEPWDLLGPNGQIRSDDIIHVSSQASPDSHDCR